MPAKKTVKGVPPSFRTVGVIASAAAFRRAMEMSSPPDLFELRLDHLFPARGLEKQIRRLPAPTIITARHPAEGGEHRLILAARRDLLLRFVSVAQYMDVELRSVKALQSLMHYARRYGVKTIISFHDFGSTPTLGRLRAMAAQAKKLSPAIFKVATRTETPAQLGRLLDFVSEKPRGLAVCAMGIGPLGAASRILLARSGSALVYTSLGKPVVEGQISLLQFRRMLRESGSA